MSNDRAHALEAILETCETDEYVVRLIETYLDLNKRYVEMTGNEQADEGVTYDRIHFDVRDDRQSADAIASRMRGLFAIVASRYPHLFEQIAHEQDP